MVIKCWVGGSYVCKFVFFLLIIEGIVLFSLEIVVVFDVVGFGIEGGVDLVRIWFLIV